MSDNEDDDIVQATLNAAAQLNRDRDESDDDAGGTQVTSSSSNIDIANNNDSTATAVAAAPPVIIDYQADVKAGDLVCDGKYEAIAKLGSGTSSTVWLARPTSSAASAANQSSLVALKIFMADPAVLDSFSYERKINEYIRQQQQQQQQQQQPQRRASTGSGDRSVSQTKPQRIPASVSKLPFAAQDAWFRVQHQHLPKAAVRPSQPPRVLCVKPEHNNSPSPAHVSNSRKKSRALSSESTELAADSSSVTPRRSPQQQQQQQQIGSPDPRAVTTRSSSSNNHNGASGGAGPRSCLPHHQQRPAGVATLLSHSLHRDTARDLQHPVLVFVPGGASVEWLMSIFQYRGVALAPMLQIVESIVEALAVLDSMHIVCCDLKPENMLFVERDRARLESVAKKSVGASRGTLFDLFRVVLIDMGLSFYLPVKQWAAGSAAKSVTASASSSSALADEESPPSARARSTSQQHPLKQVGESSAPSAASKHRVPAGGGSRKSNPVIAGLTPTADELLLLRMSNYRRGVKICTREYRSPEVLFGSSFDGRCDVWSLGCVAYELVTGSFLFDPKRDIVVPGSEHEAGSDVHERLLDLRHLWEVRRVCGEPPAKYFERYGEGGSGVYAARFVDTRHKCLRFMCECGSKKNAAEEGSAEADGSVAVGAAAAARASKKNPPADDDGLVHFCSRCFRMTVPPSAAPRDLFAETQHRFGMDADGLRYFVDFVLSCVAWAPSQRLRAADLLNHPFFVLWGRQTFA